MLNGKWMDVSQDEQYNFIHVPRDVYVEEWIRKALYDERSFAGSHIQNFFQMEEPPLVFSPTLHDKPIQCQNIWLQGLKFTI